MWAQILLDCRSWCLSLRAATIISVPVLKAHSLAQISGTLKNMMGFPPPQYYSGSHGSWKKAAFHMNMQQSLIDLNSYLTPDLTLMDYSVGMADYHLGGPHCDPPIGKIIAGYNPWEIDREACHLLVITMARYRTYSCRFFSDEQKRIKEQTIRTCSGLQ